MKILTEPIGSIPRPAYLQQAMTAFGAGQIKAEELNKLFDQATQETIKELETTGSPIISDGEQSKPSFVTYPLQGFKNFAPDGVIIPFADGHTRQLPKLTAGPFHYTTFANSYLQKAKQFSSLPIKQAVISCSAMSLLYPQDDIDGYSREQFLTDLVNDAAYDIRTCLNNGAYNVQIDFTEARLAIKLDPSKQLLSAFIDLNNQVLDKFTPEEQKRIGIHTCPGGDHDSTHSADIPYTELLPLLFKLHAGNFYLEYAAEKDKKTVLESIKANLKPNQRVFLGVTNVLDPKVETAEQISDLILEATQVIPVQQLGTTDDCGFSPFGDDTSTARDIAFSKIRARVDGTRLAEKILSN
ncbi:cobalamin-independent methionine synthase II family protein [Mucilaginibacter sp. NFX135]|uniref:cobalamin-independent methionine synthase II family protein n=1 Tax=Mucilaginibacter sp. NFX135 TaxID=3402687 RepID=UPI003AFAA2F5